jgi:hypothetical protein
MENNLSETTDRFCASCGELAIYGIGKARPHKYKNPEGVEQWLCTCCWDLHVGIDNDTEKSPA